MKTFIKLKNLFLSLFFTMLILLFTCSGLSILKVKANKYTTYTYAQVIDEQTFLYKSTSSTQPQNAYFILPNTYFVLLLSNTNEDFYKVEYNGVYGYVLKTCVKPIKEKPTTPFLTNITFRVYSSDGTNVFSSPFNTSSPQNQIVESVEVLRPLTYYGEILGDEFIENRGYSWVYCKTPSGNFGYVYKGLCDNFTPITPNQEKVTYTNSFYIDDDNSYLYNLVDVTPGLKLLLVVLICVPSLFLIYLLFKPFKLEKLKNQENNNKNNNYKNKKNFKNRQKYKNQNNKKYKNENSLTLKNQSKISTPYKTKSTLVKIGENLKNFKNSIFNKNKTENTQNNNNKLNSKKYKGKNNLNKTNTSVYKNKSEKVNNANRTKTLNTIQKIIDDEPL